MALILTMSLLILVVLYISWPLLQDEFPSLAGEPRPDLSDQERLLQEKDAVISNLKDIEMDYRMGKLSQDDYERVKREFELQAVEIFKRLEAIQAEDKKTA